MDDSATSSLYRTEALRYVSLGALGGVTVSQPLSLRVLTVFALCLVGIASCYLFVGEYARKETVTGYLEPDGGIVRVYPAGRRGVVTRLHVDEGDRVEQGDLLMELSYPSTLSSGVELPDALLSELEAQQQQLGAQLDGRPALLLAQRARLQARIREIDAEALSMRALQDLQRRRVDVAGQRLDAMATLRRQAAISESEWLTGITESIAQKQALLNVGQRLARITASRADALHSLETLAAQHSRDSLNLELQRSQVRQQIAEQRSRRRKLITAPQAGRVAALQVHLGELAAPGQPVLALVAESAKLRGVLFLPSRAIGFAGPGMTVRLSIDAFPHQQFGTLPGVVDSISSVPVLTDASAGLLPAQTPVYVARIDLPDPYLLAYGERQHLQSGMQLKADIILESRTLLDWMLEPLFSLKGRTG